MWGIVPAAGLGTRIQPLAFSKELLPIGSRFDGAVERPRAIGEYLLDRLILGGVSKICFVIAPGKGDIINYFGGVAGGAHVCYAVQPQPRGLCDAIFRALPFIPPNEIVLIGLPDTIWFPVEGYRALTGTDLTFLLFPVEHPASFDAVVTDESGRVSQVLVKQQGTAHRWVWGGMRMSGKVLRDLFVLWSQRDRSDEYLGTLVNEYIAGGGAVFGAKVGSAYVDVGTLHGYREALRLLGDEASMPSASAGSFGKQATKKKATQYRSPVTTEIDVLTPHVGGGGQP
jgi:glucose-1-phosphate thymidylyltransferase